MGMPAEAPTRLLTWFAANARTLPWREPNRTPWGVLVSEVMLQQTPVRRVEPAWPEWLARWPTPTTPSRHLAPRDKWSHLEPHRGQVEPLDVVNGVSRACRLHWASNGSTGGPSHSTRGVR